MGKLVADMTPEERQKVNEKNHERYIRNRQARIEYARERRKQHHDEIVARNRLAYHSNPDKYRKQARDSYARHIEDARERSRKRLELNRDEINEKARIRRANKLYAERERERNNRAKRREVFNERARIKYARNSEARRATAYKWRKANPAKVSNMLHNYYTRCTGNGGTHTHEEWTGILDRYGHKCLCCGSTDVKLVRDHILPVSRGGTGYISNIQPLCQSCNSKKRDRYRDYRPDAPCLDWT